MCVAVGVPGVSHGTLSGSAAYGRTYARTPQSNPVGRASHVTGDEGASDLPQAVSRTHRWVVAAVIGLPDTLAAQAFRRGTARLPSATKIEVLETYCAQCRRPYERVVDVDCEAAESKDHLIGGPTGERAKRKGADETVTAEAV